MHSHHGQTHEETPTLEELEAHYQRARALRSQTIARGMKWMLARLNRHLRSLFGRAAQTGHRRYATRQGRFDANEPVSE